MFCKSNIHSPLCCIWPSLTPQNKQLLASLLLTSQSLTVSACLLLLCRKDSVGLSWVIILYASANNLFHMTLYDQDTPEGSTAKLNCTSSPKNGFRSLQTLQTGKLITNTRASWDMLALVSSDFLCIVPSAPPPPPHLIYNWFCSRGKNTV